MVPTDGARPLMLGTCFARIVDPSVVLQSPHEPFAHNLVGYTATILEHFDIEQHKNQYKIWQMDKNINEKSQENTILL